MKKFFFFLFLPLFSFGQTIHFDDENIIYKGKVNAPGMQSGEVYARLEQAINGFLEKKDLTVETFPSGQRLQASGAIRLNSPYHIIRKVRFNLQLTAADEGYTYQLDSVYLEERRRSRKATTKNAEELLESMEETGAGGTAAERLLNEIDMRFQKLIALTASAVNGRRK
jgi:hypothetical protein